MSPIWWLGVRMFKDLQCISDRSVPAIQVCTTSHKMIKWFQQLLAESTIKHGHQFCCTMFVKVEIAKLKWTTYLYNLKLVKTIAKKVVH